LETQAVIRNLGCYSAKFEAQQQQLKTTVDTLKEQFNQVRSELLDSQILLDVQRDAFAYTHEIEESIKHRRLQEEQELKLLKEKKNHIFETERKVEQNIEATTENIETAKFSILVVSDEINELKKVHPLATKSILQKLLMDKAKFEDRLARLKERRDNAKLRLERLVLRSNTMNRSACLLITFVN